MGQDSITIKWLGIAGLELNAYGHTILVDPVYTRVRPLLAVIGGVRSDERAVRNRLIRCSHIFITHAHHDHLMDTPLAAGITGATVHGSANSCAIARACGVPHGQLCPILPGRAIKAGPFTVTALPATHIRLPGFGSGALPRRLAPPLRMSQYRMDGSLVFLVEVGGIRLLIGPGLCLSDPGRVDGLLFSPVYCGQEQARDYVKRLNPRFLLPIHWEQLFAREGRPLKPSLMLGFPPRRYDMGQAEALAEGLGIRYVEPVVDREWTIDELMD